MVEGLFNFPFFKNLRERDQRRLTTEQQEGQRERGRCQLFEAALFPGG